MTELRGNPFFLEEEEVVWVETTLKAMTMEEKAGQLFLAIGISDRDEDILEMAEKYHIGGIMYRPNHAKKLKERNDKLQAAAKIPLLIAANLENGGSGAVLEGTNFASQMEIAAAGETEQARRLGEISSREAKAVGVNLSFAPVCDIDRNWRNPITNTRTYGSNPETVREMCAAYIKGAHSNGLAVSIKHFPGDGCDERDQHLVTSVNDLSCEEWDASYGKIYKELIDQGAQTVMAGHILQPAYSRYFNPEIKESEMMPASCSKELIQGLLRGRLNFNGVVLTDAANMLGYCTVMKRSRLIPATINAGVDMILFGKNLGEDISYLKNAIETGEVSEERLNEAVTRVLALKASLGLHKKKKFTSDTYEAELCTDEALRMAKECADKAITLVKDTQHLLPVTPQTHRRVWLFVNGDKPGFTGGSRCREMVIHALERAGFSVDVYDPEHADLKETEVTTEFIRKKYDVIMYFSNVINASYQTTARIQWQGAVAQEGPYYVKEVPTLLVSLGNPYGFVDAPMIPTIINTYHVSETIIQETVNKIMGKSSFKGISPVDPFCGKFGSRI
ncbi:glycoside hydrolase family 3 protein [Clostridium sp. Marseille-P3244]|uniref:glycoside hydrolase family 3 protein n=1 Tax=Clostridium sp. Marseille-P3244 TaxID=1871020 RepID=UPI000930BF64|nr:glycoside hydrolase family 3 N-terminal domain-containing protein [Clostridium sp. Marseille-P3244]